MRRGARAMLVVLVGIYRVVAIPSNIPRKYSVEAVLSHHSEDLSWIASAPHSTPFADVTYTVYSKANVPPAGTTYRLPNVGRESHTYLHHIVTNYDNLADWTVFSQAVAPSWGFRGGDAGSGHLSGGDSWENYLKPFPNGQQTYFVNSVASVFPLGLQITRLSFFVQNMTKEFANNQICPGKNGWADWWYDSNHPHVTLFRESQPHQPSPVEFFRRFIQPDWYDTPSHTNPTIEPLVASFPCGARFAVSRAAIRQHPKGYYKALLEQVSHHVNPIQGFYMEAFWFDVFAPHARKNFRTTICGGLPPIPNTVEEALTLSQMHSKTKEYLRTLAKHGKRLAPERSVRLMGSGYTIPTASPIAITGSPSETSPTPFPTNFPTPAPNTPTMQPTEFPTASNTVQVTGELSFASMTCGSEDEQDMMEALVTKLASSAGVAESAVLMTSSCGSVILTFSISLSSSSDATVFEDKLTSQPIDAVLGSNFTTRYGSPSLSNVAMESNTNLAEGDSKDGTGSGASIGITVGVLGAVGIVAAIAVFIWRRTKKRGRHTNTNSLDIVMTDRSAQGIPETSTTVSGTRGSIYIGEVEDQTRVSV